MANRPTIPTALYRAADVRELDRLAIETGGIAGIDLMERAGLESFRVLRERWPAARRVSVVAGPGNNGGDGFVVARLAAREGLSVSVNLIADAARLAGDARTAYRRMLDAAPGPAPVRHLAQGADVIVDALFGTGLARDVCGAAAGAVHAMNDSSAPVLALDVPSGIHSDTGRVLGAAVRAAVTVSFIGLKQGLFTREGRECGGEIVYHDLGVPEHVLARVKASARRMAYDDCVGLIGPRRGDAHKGLFGHVLVVGGDHGFAGAARLAGEAAGRAGAGLVSVATRPGHVAALVASRPEMMVHGIESPGALVALLDRASVVAVGPGLGRGEWGASLLERVVATDRALVIDADAIQPAGAGLGAVAGRGGARRRPYPSPERGRPGPRQVCRSAGIGSVLGGAGACRGAPRNVAPQGRRHHRRRAGRDPAGVRGRQSGDGHRRDGGCAHRGRGGAARPGPERARCRVGGCMRARGSRRRRGPGRSARHARERRDRGASSARGPALMSARRGTGGRDPGRSRGEVFPVASGPIHASISRVRRARSSCGGRRVHNR